MLDDDDVVAARSSGTPAHQLAELAMSSRWEVRLAVSFNDDTPSDVLAQLAHDDDWRVREGAA